jgi:hypothetical protein
MSTTALTPLQIAQVIHAANLAYRANIGEEPGVAWERLDSDMQETIVHGVKVAQEGNDAEELHRQWVMVKEVQGWTYGPEKDAIKKTHPQLVPYANLDLDQRRKDSLFLAIVGALSS